VGSSNDTSAPGGGVISSAREKEQAVNINRKKTGIKMISIAERRE
jgi:hypothetical protein